MNFASDRETHSTSLFRSLMAGGKARPFWFCGPCVVENWDVTSRIAEAVAGLRERGVSVVFKASYDKANRTSVGSFRGHGLDEGLRVLERVKREFELPVITDVHESTQVAAVAEVADVLQIPAFLCRQTDLIEAACRSGRLVNVKKGQFLAPSNVAQLVEKLKHFGTPGFWITERGVTFGYGRLVVDFAAFPEMERTGAPLVLDVTHAVQLPGMAQGSSGGIREAIPYLARAGSAAGVNGFFAETHPDPARALSDGPNAWPLDRLEELVLHCRRISEAAHGV